MMYSATCPSEQYFSLEHPATLVEGNRYYLIDRPYGRRSCLKTITFVDYTACPAVVMIANGYGIRSRCLRDELWGFSQTSVPDQDEGSGR